MNAHLVCVLLRWDKTLDEDVVRTVDVTVGTEVARGTVEGAFVQRQCVLHCSTAGACSAHVLFNHSRESCPRDLTFEG